MGASPPPRCGRAAPRRAISRERAGAAAEAISTGRTGMHGMTDPRWAMAGMAVALVTAGFLAGSGFVLVWAQGHVHKHEHGGGEIAVPWLTRLGPEARMRAIERQFDGFAPAMADVAYRYVELYFGGIDGNWDYAAHMIEEMKITIANGLERRPQYRGHAETLLL